MRTGWPPGLLQDDDRWLSKWFASKPDARRLVREKCKEIEREHMNQHTELIERLRFFDRVYCTQAADTLEAQEAEIARLNKAIRYEENYLARIGTHGPDCWKWGPQHYQCALAEIARREAAAEIGKAMP